MTTLRDIMTSQIVSVDGEATLKEVATVMLEQDIGAVLVMEGETLRGVITDRDIVVRAVAYGHDIGTPVKDYTTEQVVTLEADTGVEEAASVMGQRQIRRLPVTDGGKVVGMVSLGDLATRAESGVDEQALAAISTPTV